MNALAASGSCRRRVSDEGNPLQATHRGEIAPVRTSGQRLWLPLAACGHSALVLCELQRDERSGAKNSTITEIPQSTTKHTRQWKAAAGFNDMPQVNRVDYAGSLPGARTGTEYYLSICALRFRPIAADNSLNPALRARVSSNRLCITTKAVVFGIADYASTHGVKINIGSECLKDSILRFDKDAFEALRPKRSEAAVRLVEPNREALFDELHELRNVVHERELSFSPHRSFRPVAGKFNPNDVEPRCLVRGWLRIQDLESPKQLDIGDWLALRHPDLNVEMVCQNCIGNDFDAAKIGDLPKLLPKDLLGHVVEQHLPIYGARHAVIHGGSFIRGNLDSSLAHGNQCASRNSDAQPSKYPNHGVTCLSLAAVCHFSNGVEPVPNRQVLDHLSIYSSRIITCPFASAPFSKDFLQLHQRVPSAGWFRCDQAVP